MSLNPSIVGYLADSGRRYVSIEADHGAAILPYEDFGLANKTLAHDLNLAGLPLFAEEDLDAIITEVRAIKDFIPGRVRDHVGWSDKSFAFLDQTVACGDGPSPEVLYPGNDRVARHGTINKWKKHVALPLKDHPIPAFALMAMFLPPLLRFLPQVGSPIFELVGPGFTGKTVTQVLAASAIGPRRYVCALKDIKRDPAKVQRDTRDHPLIVDHVASALAVASKPQKAETFAALAFDTLQAPGNRVVLLSGRSAFREACGMTSDEDRIITLAIPEGPLGVLTAVPNGFSNGAEFVDSLLAAAASNHGLAFPEFVKKLHADLTADAAAVKARISRLHASFLSRAVDQGIGGVAYRDASAIAAVYVAGMMAKRYKVLSLRLNCMATALAVHDLHRGMSLARPQFTDRLHALASDSRLVVITPEVDETTQSAAAMAALATITVKGGKRIIKIRPAKIEEAFEDWKSIRNTPDVRAVLKVDGKNLATWGTLAPGMKRERLHQFVLPHARDEQSTFTA